LNVLTRYPGGAMLTRRDFLHVTAVAGLALALPRCSASPPLRRDVFPDFGGCSMPYLGLATSLHKEHDYECRVEGTIPPQLRGTFYRIGPGLFDRDNLRRRTVLDGDGMVQSFTFHNPGVRYRNRFVQTKRYVEEEAAGKFLYPTWGTQAPGGLLANFWRAEEVTSQASVTVYEVNGRLYAFDEGSLPYELDPVSLATVGETSFGLSRNETIYAAHSKIDRIRGEWLHFGIQFGPSPRIHITIFGRGGELVSHRSFPLPRNIYMHDWFVTDRWLILNIQPVDIRVWGFLLGLRSMFDSLRWNPGQGNLLMLVEKQGNAPPIFIETEARFMWHSINAHMNKGEIIGDFIGYDNPDHLIGPDSAATAIMQGRKGNHRYPGTVRRYVIDPDRKNVREELVTGDNFEWPRINEQHSCHRYRFAFINQGHAGEFFWSIITRVDMLTGKKSSYDFGRSQYCSEPVFIPIPGTSYNPDDAEEPGWLLSEVYDSVSRTSYLAILRAEKITDGPIAKIHLTHHAPFSYHGWWSAG
jgi:all-trans-8'-apo-beta-carotenal 15,15'-oxygenase